MEEGCDDASGTVGIGRGETVAEEEGETDRAMGDGDCDEAGDGFREPGEDTLGCGGNGLLGVPRTVDARARRDGAGGGGKDRCETAGRETITFFFL